MVQANRSTKAIKMYLNINNEELDLAEAGLLDASFDRFGNPDNENSGILTRLDLVVFDAKGSQVLNKMAGRDAKTITFRYGFVDDQAENKYVDLSPEYTLDIIKLKTRWTQGGATVSIGAVGHQTSISSGARVYQRGEYIEKIVLDIARAQGWDTSYVIIDPSLQLSQTVYKDAKTEDWDFIDQVIKPQCYTAGIVEGKSFTSWVVRLFTMGAETYLQFAPTGASIERRVWVYDIGKTNNSSVIEFTSELDLSFLINGLNIVLYNSDVSSLIVNNDRDAVTEANTPESEIQKAIKENVEDIIQAYNLPVTLPDSLNFNVTLKFSEDTGSLTVKQRVLAALDYAIQSVSKVTLKVIGNPQIRPADLIKLEAVYNDQTSNLISANGDRSLWKVIQITENVGLGGYTTDLVLAREILKTGGSL